MTNAANERRDPVLSLGRREMRAILASAQRALTAAEVVLDTRSRAEQAVAAVAEAVRAEQVAAQLRVTPLESLRGSMPGRIAWKALSDAGISNLDQIWRMRAAGLVAINGVGEQTAEALTLAVDAIVADLIASAHPVIAADGDDPASAELAAALVRLDQVLEHTRRSMATAADVAAAFPDRLLRAAPARSRLRWWFTPLEQQVRARLALTELREVIRSPQLEHMVRTAAAPPAPLSTNQAWQSFIADPARYQSLLDAQVGTDARGAGRDAHDVLTDEVIAGIDAITLDSSSLSVMLRRYQDFGARFVIAQKRVLLGDDMGLGKTVQALAAMAHLHAQGGSQVSRFLVIAPASVLVNWEREAAGKSDLDVHALHSSRPAENRDRWLAHGGIAITTYEYLPHLHLPDRVDLDLLVVDEAHYVKNPQTQRSARVAALVARTQRVLLMTGTPIENHGGEFIELVRMLDPLIADRLESYAVLVSPEEFRRRVAPLYLRRNSEDVLTELPELIEIDEWEEMTDHDVQHYRLAVTEGNFMAMRRAGFGAGRMRRSAKLDRLLEVIDMAQAGGHRVLVYTYFLDVVDIVVEALGPRARGPLTGATTPAARQQLVDEFGTAPPGTALVAQITSGGVGLNIQAASVVILCEPQLKPSTERQAIKRAHRMGQLNAVRVHRLLNPQSIDERILEILGGKEAEFAAYAADSDLAAAADDAFDSRTVLGLIQGERDRLGITDNCPPAFIESESLRLPGPKRDQRSPHQ